MPAGTDPRALYSDTLKHWARKVRADRRLAHADISITRTSRLCGSTVTLDIQHQGDTLTALGWRTRACTLGMAATAVVVATARGRHIAEVLAAGQQLEALLAGQEVDFPAGWEALAMFQAARTLPARHGSILLPFAAVAELVDAGTLMPPER